MYFAAYAAKSKCLILGSRFIVGLGAGAGATIFAELAQTTDNKQRTTIFSIFMATRQFGLIVGKCLVTAKSAILVFVTHLLVVINLCPHIGPAFNIFLQETNFYIGPFPVNPFSSPGVSNK